MRAIARPVPWLEAGTHVGWLSGSIGPGTDTRFPTIEDVFTDADAPGLAAQPDYRYADLYGAIDYRDQKGNARAGGYYSVTWRRYADLDFDLYNFREIDAVVQQFVPIFDKKRVFAVQGASCRRPPTMASRCPSTFNRPWAAASLRSYNDFRFRDETGVSTLSTGGRHSQPSTWRSSTMGSVAPEVDDLRLSNLKDGYGIGFRFNTLQECLYRIDIGFGGADGVRYFFKFSKAF